MVLVLFGCAIVLINALLKPRRKAGKDEPPIVQERNYWQGCTKQMITNGHQFLSQCRLQYGDIFTLRMNQQKYITYLLDPTAFHNTLNGKEFRALPDLKTHFGVRLEAYEDAKRFSFAVRNGFTGTHFTSTLEKTQLNVKRYLPNGLKQGALHDAVKHIIIPANVDTLFGQGTCNEKFLEVISTFLQAVPPRYRMGKQPESPEMSTILKTLHPQLIEKRENVAPLYSRLKSFAQTQSKDEEYVSICCLQILWASLVNTVQATFWTIYHIFQDEHALKALREEIISVFGVPEKIDSSPSEFPDITNENLAKMVVLESALAETLRVVSRSHVLREALVPAEITLGNDKVFKIRKGDIVAMYTCALHEDPEVFDSPDKYQWNRFLNKDKTWTKYGKKLKSPVISFGGGMTWCPGREYAKSLVRLSTIYLAYYYDMEFTSKVGDTDPSGMTSMPHPENDIRVSFKPRS